LLLISQSVSEMALAKFLPGVGAIEPGDFEEKNVISEV
jgi:hypothetical protein